MTDKELMKIMKAVGNALAENAEHCGAVTVAFEPYTVGFPVRNGKNKGVMRLAYCAPGTVSLQLGVFRKGTDRLYSNYLFKGTAEEMLRYVRDEAKHKGWMESADHLSKSVDDFWD